jgi:hypothetical protein
MATQLGSAHVQGQFLSGVLEVATEAQYLLEADCSGVYVRPPSFPANTLRSLQPDPVQPFFRRMRQLCAKLSAHGYGDYCLNIGVIGAQYFESRDQFDLLYAGPWLTNSDEEEQGHAQDKLTPVKAAIRISLVAALAEHFHVTLSCNMDYYKRHPQAGGGHPTVLICYYLAYF